MSDDIYVLGFFWFTRCLNLSVYGRFLQHGDITAVQTVNKKPMSAECSCNNVVGTADRSECQHMGGCYSLCGHIIITLTWQMLLSKVTDYKYSQTT